MYAIIIILIIAGSLYLVYRGMRSNRKGLMVWGILLALAGYLFFWFMGFWAEMLWFSSLGYESRFWIFELTRLGFIFGGFLLGYLAMLAITLTVRSPIKYFRRVAATIAGMVTAGWGNSYWDTFLRFFYRVDTGIIDPILGRDAGFYLFTLPFLDALIILLLMLFIIGLMASVLGGFNLRREGNEVWLEPVRNHTRGKNNSFRSIYFSLGSLVLVLAVMKFLDRYHLLFSDYGVVSGPGWTDVNVRLPALWIVSVITLLVALIFYIPRLHRFADKGLIGIHQSFARSWIMRATGILGITFLIWIIALSIIPGLFQWLRVEPNELRAETPYLQHSIEFTRKAFALDRAEEREYPVSEVFTQQTYEDNQLLFENIRLWDYRALEQVYKQFQEIRLYYEFNDVDIDRYVIDNEYRQVMVSAREMEQRNLPAQSQTFINRRFIYTHGMGITLTGVSEFSENGLPVLLIRDIPPVSRFASLEVTQPRIYYGELTQTHVIVNSNEQEFDYPSGDQNEYYSYTGAGGVAISNQWRKFLFGWKFDGTRLFFSGAPGKDSRILFHRQIQERVHTLAPFLIPDHDPYITLIEGRLVWILDTYVTSGNFPYSESFRPERYTEVIRGQFDYQQRVTESLINNNYLRNSVKAVIDAYTGKVDLYVFEPEDPIIRVWQKILPDLFKSKEQMPREIRQHIRYPADLLLTQGLVYAKFHMRDPTVFYNQEDLWVQATENYYGTTQPVEPYYVMWDVPQDLQQEAENGGLEFILMQPFTPKTRQVAIGWLAGMCDGDNYGRLLAYQFPKEKRVLGPQQFETKIDQDATLSGQLSLWDQRGSRVIRGNVLAIPVDQTLLYVEPIYLQAETAAYPELRLVALMHQDKLSYATSFGNALKGLFGEATPEATAPLATGIEELIQQAGRAFEDYVRYTGQRDFENAARALDELQNLLQKMGRQQSPENP